MVIHFINFLLEHILATTFYFTFFLLLYWCSFVVGCNRCMQKSAIAKVTVKLFVGALYTARGDDENEKKNLVACNVF